MTTLPERLQRLRLRRTDPRTGRLVLAEARDFEKLAKAFPQSPGAARAYIDESALAVEPIYTKRSYAAAKRVRAAIDASLDQDTSVEYELQGSVTNDTHIRVHSDIDLLVITTAFVTLKPPLKVTRPYSGDAVETLLHLRNACEEALDLDLELEVNAAGSKALAVVGANLECKVDIVPANWLDTAAYRTTKSKALRGVQVIDTEKRARITNYPFLHNERIEERDRELDGALRPAIRLIKSIRSDSSESMRLSSFDIAALCYRIPDGLWPESTNGVALVQAFLRFARQILIDEELYATLRVANDQRLIFGPDGTDRESLTTLAAEAYQLLESCAV